MPVVGPGGRFKLRFDWYIIFSRAFLTLIYFISPPPQPRLIQRAWKINPKTGDLTTIGLIQEMVQISTGLCSHLRVIKIVFRTSFLARAKAPTG